MPQPNERPPISTRSITSMIVPETPSSSGEYWRVTLYFRHREITIPFFHYQKKPTTREIIERLSFEIYEFSKFTSFHDWVDSIRWAYNDPEIRKIYDQKVETTQKMKYLLGDGHYFLFINDIDKFACVMVENSEIQSEPSTENQQDSTEE